MSVLYIYRCDIHGETEVRKPMSEASVAADCPECYREGWTRPMQRVYTPPVTDCHSFGRNTFTTRTLPIHRKPQDAMQEERIRDLRRRDHTHTQFGAGSKTTGS